MVLQGQIARSDQAMENIMNIRSVTVPRRGKERYTFAREFWEVQKARK